MFPLQIKKKEQSNMNTKRLYVFFKGLAKEKKNWVIIRAIATNRREY